MSKFNSLAMSKRIAKDDRVSINKSLFGLLSCAVYKPTSSKLTARKIEYRKETGEKIEDALKLPKEKQAEQLAAIGKLPRTTLGNYLLEECHSADNSFAALRLYKFTEMSYQPVTEVCYFENDAAKTVIGSL